jgi:LysM repeat protein
MRPLWKVVLIVMVGLSLVPYSPVRAQGINGQYVVQPGDTLFNLARRHGINVQDLAAANNLDWRSSWLYVGQVIVIPTAGAPPAAPAPSNSIYTVRPGDTLIGIALRHGVTVAELARANGLFWNSWVYVGQRLTIPGGTISPAPSPAPQPAPGVHVVQVGDTLFSIARRYGTSVAAIQSYNGLGNANLIYVGQSLKIPPADYAPPAPTPAPPPSGYGLNGEKWIDINLSTQRITAYEGTTAVYTALVSTGIARYPTVVGTFKIYAKYLSTRMTGGSGADYYDLPNVPHTMYFYRGYAIHGAYWHNNFGTPMSHGCVNLSLPDAEWFYNWAPIGTTVVTHY